MIDVFIDDLDISGMGFKAEPAATGRPGYHPKMMRKLYVYGYLNRVQSSRRLKDVESAIERYLAHHLIVAHEVSKVGSDRQQLSKMTSTSARPENG